MENRYTPRSKLKEATKIAHALQEDPINQDFFAPDKLPSRRKTLEAIGYYYLPTVLSSRYHEDRYRAGETILEQIRIAEEKNQQFLLPKIVTTTLTAEQRDMAKEIERYFMETIDLEFLDSLKAKGLAGADGLETIVSRLEDLNFPLPFQGPIETSDDMTLRIDFLEASIAACRQFYAQRDAKIAANEKERKSTETRYTESLRELRQRLMEASGGALNINAPIGKNEKTTSQQDEDELTLSEIMAAVNKMNESIASGKCGPQECWEQIKDYLISMLSGGKSKDAAPFAQLSSSLRGPITSDMTALLAALCASYNDIMDDPRIRKEEERNTDREILEAARMLKKLQDADFKREEAMQYVLICKQNGAPNTLIGKIIASQNNVIKKEK